MALIGLNGEEPQQYYDRLKVALEVAITSDVDLLLTAGGETDNLMSTPVLYNFLSTGGETEGLLPMPRPTTTLLGIIMSQQGSAGELLNLVVDRIHKYRFSDLLKRKGTIDDFIMQECVQLRPSEERIADFEIRVGMIAQLNPYPLETLIRETKLLVLKFEKASRGEEVKFHTSFELCLHSTEVIKETPSLCANYNKVLEENLVVLKKVFDETPKPPRKPRLRQRSV